MPSYRYSEPAAPLAPGEVRAWWTDQADFGVAVAREDGPLQLWIGPPSGAVKG